MRTSISARTPDRRGLGIAPWLTTTLSFMSAAFLFAFAMAALVLSVFGAGERGTVLALQVTARWSFLLFWLAYAGSALAKLYGPRLGALARRGREFGLAFASAQLVHVGLVLWIIHISSKPGGAMIFFWV